MTRQFKPEEPLERRDRVRRRLRPVRFQFYAHRVNHRADALVRDQDDHGEGVGQVVRAETLEDALADDEAAGGQEDREAREAP